MGLVHRAGAAYQRKSSHGLSAPAADSRMNQQTNRQSATELRDAIASIQRQLDEVAFASKPVRDKLSQLDKESSRLKAERKRLEDLLEAVTEGIEVSDHALVRYLERHLGYDFDEVRKAMITPGVRAAVNVGAEGVKAHGGTFKIKGRTITTFFSAKEGR